MGLDAALVRGHSCHRGESEVNHTKPEAQGTTCTKRGGRQQLPRSPDQEKQAQQEALLSLVVRTFVPSHQYQHNPQVQPKTQGRLRKQKQTQNEPSTGPPGTPSGHLPGR